MASSRQEYFILRNHVPIGKTNNFFRNWLSSQNADCVLQGELLVKEAQPQDGSHATYSLTSDGYTKVSCASNDVAPLSQDDYEWLVAIQKPVDRFQVYGQQEKLDAIKRLKLDDKVCVSLPTIDGASFKLATYCCTATVRYIGPLKYVRGRWVGVELVVRQKVLLAMFSEVLYSSQPYILHDKQVDSQVYNTWYTVSRSTRRFNPSRAFISCTKQYMQDK